jgi:superfamily II DNA or RNA helicase
MVQTVATRDARPPADGIYWDEAHHAMAEQWRSILQSYPEARLVGLTATPQRLDGKPLGDVFEQLVVAATYPELLAQGHLVDCRVYKPPEIPGGGLACDPLDAWKRYGEQSQTFGFASSVVQATELAARFNAAGIPSGVIEAGTPARERDELLEQFRAGALKVLWNVYCLTEGTDVPSARCVLLARSCAHVSMYLQIVGRVLRPHASKQDAILIDLSGATLMHGLPLEDRAYSLSGKGIQRTSLEALKNCQQCGATILSAYQVCPECGFSFPVAKRKGPRIYSMELELVFAGSATPEDAKQREFSRLLSLCESKGWSVWFACKQFQELFGRLPSAELRALPRERQRELFSRMCKGMAAKGRSFNQVRGAWKNMAGAWPDWSWR